LYNRAVSRRSKK